VPESFDSWVPGLGREWEGHRVRVRLPLLLRGIGALVCLPFSFQAGKVIKKSEEELVFNGVDKDRVI
jgi:hypothetical protein